MIFKGSMGTGSLSEGVSINMNSADKQNELLEREIENKEKELMQVKRELAQLRKRHPKFAVQNYSLTNIEGGEVLLSDLFGNHKEMIVIHNMGKSCSYCTLWADGFSGFTQHLENRSAFVLTSPDEYKTLANFSKSRGWTFKSVSTRGTTFKEDDGFRDEKGYLYPGVSILVKEEDGSITHHSKAAFGPGDDYCSIWSLFDLLPEGNKGWSPKNSYWKRSGDKMSTVVTKEFKLAGQKNKGLFKDYGTLVPQAAHRFLQNAGGIPQPGNEVTIYEPRRNENHEEGLFYVGLLVDQQPENLPEGIEYLEVQHTYAMIRGNGSEIGSLYSMLEQWIAEQSLTRAAQENFIVEVYYPVSGGEEVEIYIPIS